MTTTPSTAARLGGCLCGSIRFEAAGLPDYPHTCSCPHCQKLGGGPMMSWVSFPLTGVVFTGELAWFYTYPGETKRGRCPVCGAQVCALDDGASSIAINLSALDDASDLVPVNQSFRETAVPWLAQVPDTRCAAAG
ncbi:GFA family protein [Streptomyces graminilatus]|uniref:GFA family protein n=1 Tax=Streptomyces graminilatus TaxID=1464070 RepID=UPI0006E40F08|nr:GFA family protein [Streptomyces graminilatus]